MISFRPFLTYAAVLGAVFAIALAAGYVYSHEPERDLVEVLIDRTVPVATDGQFVSGTIVAVGEGTATIETALGTFEVPLADVSVEALRALEDPTAAPVGVAVNLGGERTATERVITGVVLLTSEAAQ